jgi:uncharacterized metal-binding protein
VIYFLGVVTGIVYLAVLAAAFVNGAEPSSFRDLVSIWETIGLYVRTHFGQDFLLVLFAGLWLGAASHTLTDMAGSFIKTGRTMKFF